MQMLTLKSSPPYSYRHHVKTVPVFSIQSVFVLWLQDCVSLHYIHTFLWYRRRFRSSRYVVFLIMTMFWVVQTGTININYSEQIIHNPFIISNIFILFLRKCAKPVAGLCHYCKFACVLAPFLPDIYNIHMTFRAIAHLYWGPNCETSALIVFCIFSCVKGDGTLFNTNPPREGPVIVIATVPQLW